MNSNEFKGARRRTEFVLESLTYGFQKLRVATLSED